MLDPTEGRTVLLGGIDVSTLLPLPFPLVAPGHSMVVSPLTTLIAAVIDRQGVSMEEAHDRVREKFGLSDVDLLRLDPILGTVLGNPEAPYVFLAGVEVQNTVVEAASFVSAIPGAPDIQQAATMLYDALAESLTPMNATLDLAEAGNVESLIGQVLQLSGLSVDHDILAGVSEVIAAGNGALDAVPVTSDEEFLTQVARIQVVAQGLVASELAGAATGEFGIESVVATYTGTGLDNNIASASIGNVLSSVISVSDVTLAEGDSGQSVYEFEVSLSRPSALPVSVDFTTADLTATISDGDYIPADGSLAWAVGDNTTKTVQVEVVGDTIFEPDEFFQLFLSSPRNALLDRGIGFGTITNDDTGTLTSPNDGLPDDWVIYEEGGYLRALRNGSLVLEHLGQNSAPIVIEAGASDPLPAGEYRFRLVVADTSGNTSSPHEVSVVIEDAQSSSHFVTGFDVQKGAIQRSYLRYLDVGFNQSDGLTSLVNTLADGDATNDRIRLRRYDLNGGSPELVDLSTASIRAVDTAIEFDFGAGGIGGDPASYDANGYYELMFDLEGDGLFETDLHFFRLQGDVTGDGAVDITDLYAIRAAFGQFGSAVEEDLNGDGRVTSADYSLARYAYYMGYALSEDLENELDD